MFRCYRPNGFAQIAQLPQTIQNVVATAHAEIRLNIWSIGWVIPIF